MVILVSRFFVQDGQLFAFNPIFDCTASVVGRVEVGADGFTRLHVVNPFRL